MISVQYVAGVHLPYWCDESAERLKRIINAKKSDKPYGEFAKNKTNTIEKQIEKAAVKALKRTTMRSTTGTYTHHLP